MRIINCDKCGERIGYLTEKNIFVQQQKRFLLKTKILERHYDLCGDCMKDFEKWIENEKEEVVTYDTIRKEIKELDQAIKLEWDNCKDVGVTQTFNMLGFAKQSLEELIGEEE